MVSIARRNLFADIPRLVVAQAGIMFAVSLVTIQTGILEGFTRSTTLVIDHSPADMWVASEDMVYLELTSSTLTTEQLEDLQAIEGVEAAEPLFVSGSRWNSDGGQITPVSIFAFDPNGRLFSPGELVEGDWASLNRPFTAIGDRANLESLGVAEVGDFAELNLIFVELAGIVKGTQSIAGSAYIYSSLANAYEYIGLPYIASDGEAENPLPIGPTTYFLVDLAEGADADLVAEQIAAAFPGYLAYPKAEMIRRTQSYWRRRTSVGFILGTGAVVGIVVGGGDRGANFVFLCDGSSQGLRHAQGDGGGRSDVVRHHFASGGADGDFGVRAGDGVVCWVELLGDGVSGGDDFDYSDDRGGGVWVDSGNVFGFGCVCDSKSDSSGSGDCV